MYQTITAAGAAVTKSQWPAAACPSVQRDIPAKKVPCPAGQGTLGSHTVPQGQCKSLVFFRFSRAVGVIFAPGQDIYLDLGLRA